MVRRAFIIIMLAVVLGLAGTVYAGPKEFAEVVKGAEQEGQVSWQCGLRDFEAKPLIETFQKKYPKIKVSVVKESGSQEKLMREVQAGAEIADIIQFDADTENDFAVMGVLEQVNWGDFNVLPQLRFNKDVMVGTHLHSYIFVFNTKLLKKADAPKTWNDFLDPKWKGGKFTVDTSYNAYLKLVTPWGEAKVIDFLTKLGAQKPIFVRGHSATMALMAAGQYTLSADCMLASAMTVRDKGAPLDWNAPDVVPVETSKSGILKKVKHPNAAKLFLGWMGSEGFKLVGNPARLLPYGDTYTAKLFAGKALAWTPTPEQVPDRAAFFTKAMKALGVPQ